MLQLKDTDWLIGHKNKTQIYAVYKKLTSDLKTHNRLKMRGWKNTFHANGKQKKKNRNPYIRYAAAAAAKSLQSCPTLCDPRDGSPPGSPIPGIL